MNFKSDLTGYLNKVVRHTARLIEVACCPAVILSFVYNNHTAKFWIVNCYMYIICEHFCILSILYLEWCFSMTSIFWAWCFGILCINFTHHFCILHHSKSFISKTESCSLWNSTFNSCDSSNQDIQKRMIKSTRTIIFCSLKILIPFAKTSTGDTYVTTSYCLPMCIIHRAKWLRSKDCTYSGTKLLSSYPSFKEPCDGKLCVQVTIMWHALLESGQPQTYSARLPVR